MARFSKGQLVRVTTDDDRCYEGEVGIVTDAYGYGGGGNTHVKTNCSKGEHLWLGDGAELVEGANNPIVTVTMEEIAAKLNIPVEMLRIKKED